MFIDTYVSNKDRSKFASVPAGTDISKLGALGTVDPDIAPQNLKPFKMDHAIERGKPYVALNPDEILDDIERDGFAYHRAAVTVQEG